ncbi:similar to CYCLIN D3;2 [Actinidia rufa]|uniref:Similar to CYCLIN D32 n=1 Tax=Actinidia rufa TaxID=165716 RepID=A0A7J0DBC6_9ERIC|nr:similar to CYCLIN D3;2 [Actinidia rufa]
MSQSHHQQLQQNLPFILDALYCQEEDYFGEEEEQSCYNDNIAPPPPLLLPEQDLFWEEEELTSLLSKERENQFHSKLEENPSLVGLRREAVGVPLQRPFPEREAMDDPISCCGLSLSCCQSGGDRSPLPIRPPNSKFMCYLPSVLATATMLHIINGVDPCLALDYQTQVLGTIGINKVGAWSLLPIFLGKITVYTLALYLKLTLHPSLPIWSIQIKCQCSL